MTAKEEMGRRDFLKVSGVGLLVGIYLSSCGELPPQVPSITPSPTSTDTEEPIPDPTATPRPTPNPEATMQAGIFVQVDGRGFVTGYLPRTELGQGSLTAFAMIIAEELDLPLHQVRIEHSPLDRAYGDLHTGGSDSISSYYSQLAKAASIARALLVTAAANLLDLPYESFSTAQGQVIHEPSGISYQYAELVELAAEIPIPTVTFYTETKDPAEYRIIGTPVSDLASHDIISGSATYASDITLPGMLYAAMAFPPNLRGKVASFDASQALALPGIQDVFAIDSGVAVLADNTWSAMQGVEALQVDWEPGPYAELNSKILRDAFLANLDPPVAEDSQILEAIYEVPFFCMPHLNP